MIISHAVYEQLGSTKKSRLDGYQELFALDLRQEIIEEIRESTNKCWVLGNKKFKFAIEKKINRKIAPSKRWRSKISQL